MTVYARQIATAKRLIAAKGQVVTWQQITDASPIDASKPWKPASPAMPTVFYPKVAFFSYNSATPHLRNAQEGFGKDGEFIQGKLYGIMAVQSFVPTLKDVITRNGSQLSLDMIDPLQVNEEIIIYTLGFII